MSAIAHPLRIAYVRLTQAAIAIHIVKLEDPDLGGSPRHLEDTLSSIGAARVRIEELAAAERIDLTNEADE
jgi:hypothetical protein